MAIQRDKVIANAEKLVAKGKIDAAIKEYSKVIELRPDLPEAYSNLAVAQKKKGELNEAIVNLNKALERKPDFASAITTRGAIFALRSQTRRIAPRAGANAIRHSRPRSSSASRRYRRVRWT